MTESGSRVPLLVNVCGAQRSGTTMLDLMLGSGRDAFSLREVFAWFRPFEARHYRLTCACGERPCPIWSQVKDLREEEFHRGVADRLGMSTVVDSSKALTWVRDANRWAAEAGMQAANVLIWKDPLQLGYSFWKRGWLRDVQGPNPTGGRVKSLGLETFYLYYEEFFETGLPYVSVSYQTLTESPGQVLASLSRAIQTEYLPGQERFWESPHHHLFGSGTVARGLHQGVTVIERKELHREFLDAAEGFAAEIARSDRTQEAIRRLRMAEVGHDGLKSPGWEIAVGEPEPGAGRGR